MAFDLLTTSGINSLVNSFASNEIQKRVYPLNTRKSKYTNISNAYSTLLTKVDALKSKAYMLKATGTSSVFAVKKATSSNTTAVTVTAGSASQQGAFSLRVNQLAKNDLLISLDKNSNDFSGITAPGEFTFAIKSGDGEGGQFVSNVKVELNASDFTNGNISFNALASKISKAINDDKAVVTSNSVTGNSASSGAFNLNLNGTTTVINYSSGFYEEVIDSIISQVNNLSGIKAEKVANGSNLNVKFTVTDSSKYLSINGDTGGIVSELGIAVNKEKGASGLVSATSFVPANGLTQISLTAKNSGIGFKIEEVSDITGSLLAEFGLNLGSTRTSFVQNGSGSDTPGFVYNLSTLNSKIVFNGLNIERSSNTVNDLVSGVSINLKSVLTPEENDVTVDIANDVSSVKSKIDEFITSFNELYNYLKSNSSSSNGSRGILVGDVSASSLNRLLSSLAYTSVAGISSSSINSLSKLGITFNVNSGLSITDSNQLTDAINSNVDEVEQLFTSDNGVAASLFASLESYSGYSGSLAKQKSSADENIKSINDSITKVQNKIDKESNILRNRYIELQSQLSMLLSSAGSYGNNLFE